jgi:hypothetical protein
MAYAGNLASRSGDRRPTKNEEQRKELVDANCGASGLGVGGSPHDLFDPTSEDEYWSKNYQNRFYFEKTVPYDQYRPAYRYGWEARFKHPRCAFEAIEAELKEQWQASRAQSNLNWDQAREATRDAWDRIGRKFLRRSRAPRFRMSSAEVGLTER